MSADNWALCPRCIRRQAREISRLDLEREKFLQEMYGTVPADDYLAAVQEPIEYPQLKDGGQTFREDYEIYGARDGEVMVTYHGECIVCHLVLEFRDVHSIPDVDK